MIVKMTKKEYIDFPGGVWCDHFVKRTHYYKVADYRNASCSVKLIDCKGSVSWAPLNNCEIVKE